MNLDVDFSVVIKVLRGAMKELREKRLWPVAVALLVAIVAVPIVLSSSSSPAPLAQVPQPTPPAAGAASIPAISEQSTPAHSRLTRSAHNPFIQQDAGKASTATASTTTSSRTTSAATGGSTTTTSSGGGAATSAPPPTSTTTKSSATAPKSITPNAKPKTAPAGLAPTQSYNVSLVITNSSGGLNSIDSLNRLSVLPDDQTPMLVELGVLQGGKRVLFAVQPGTIVNGPGVCTPGPIDCEVLSLGQDQTEGMAKQSTGGVIQGPLFAVTGITASDHSSASAADQARRAESSVGRRLLDQSTLSALSLFRYQPSVGAVVDLRDLAVGGS